MELPDRDANPAGLLTAGWVIGALLLGAAATLLAGVGGLTKFSPLMLTSLAGFVLLGVGCYVGFQSLTHAKQATNTRPRIEAYESFAAARQTAWLAGAMVILAAVLLIAPLYAPAADGRSAPSPTASPTDR